VHALATLVVAVHMAFVAFVVVGGVLALRCRRAAWIHLPAALWGAAIALGGFVCPLTPLENWLRVRGGGAAYERGFLEHYLLPILYPVALTRDWQIATGAFVLAVNALVYWRVFARPSRRRSTDSLAQRWQRRSESSKEVNHVQDPHSR
jgi:Protein of Unknown function (DUF2784)